MNEGFERGLADATAHWLAYRRLSGFERLFSEALLMIPVAEYLLGHGYEVDAERDTRSVCDIGKPGEANFDIAAEKGSEKLLLEMKYLKTSGDQRIIKDLVKLALPPLRSDLSDLNYERLFLIGYHTEAKSGEKTKQTKSALVEKICTAKKECWFRVTGDATVYLHLDGIDERQPFSGEDQSSVKKWLTDWSKLNHQDLEFHVKSFRTQSQDLQNAIVLSVHPMTLAHEE